MKNGYRIKGICLLLLSAGLVGIAIADTTYMEEQKGTQSLKRFFGNDTADASLLWTEAQEKQEDGALRAASKTYQKIYMRWPNSLEAPALCAHKPIYYWHAKWQEAFDLYQYGLIIMRIAWKTIVHFYRDSTRRLTKLCNIVYNPYY